jgi:hypothetical protein
VLAAGLALAASVMWGCADFFGRLFSRRLTVATTGVAISVLGAKGT